MSDRVAQSRKAINHFYRVDENDLLDRMLEYYPVNGDNKTEISLRAVQWIKHLRNNAGQRTLLEDFMQRYSLSTAEGVALMSIAEAFLRVPDNDMADRLIVDKIAGAEWHHDGGHDEKLMTAFSGFGLRLSESLLKQKTGTIGKLAQRLGLPVIRQAVAQAIKLLGGQFVCGRDIEQAIKNAAKVDHGKYNFSFDMLGEGARTMATADAYFASYKHAINVMGLSRDGKDMYRGDGISIKLSALHPRYEEAQREACLPILVARVTELAVLAKQYNMLVTLDAEEADRLEMSLDIFAAVLLSPQLAGYDGLGLAVQAYHKRAIAVIDYLAALARAHGKNIPVRLVKGAYWDSEIKRAQERGLSGYPVFTRKTATDVSYLTAADKMLAAHDALYPAFATHNAYTISAILALAEKHGCTRFEFQRLFGMGQQLYDTAFASQNTMPPCRIYAPVGVHRDLLPYLVRRLLENGANSSFVHQIYTADVPVETLATDPGEKLRTLSVKAHPKIPLPLHLYGDRLNSIAPDLSDVEDRTALLGALPQYRDFKTPPDNQIADVLQAMQAARENVVEWQQGDAASRAQIIDRVAEIYERHRDQLIALCVYEGKKTVVDAIAEWREAVDFCRYYAQQAHEKLVRPTLLPGPTGEANVLRLEGRGVFVCISPWNFPLAIFTGQVVAALVAGNAVVAKPAEQTPAIAAFAVKLMHQAGVPQDVLHLVVGDGAIGAACVEHPNCAGVVFTGSTDTAWRIQSALANKRGPIVPFIAETGGQNTMIVDSTALAEQVVDDVIRSAFHSAGQRCSALRVLFLQNEIADTVTQMLAGALGEIRVGDPVLLSTDVGPVIDGAAQATLEKHQASLADQMIAQAPQTDQAAHYVLPTIFAIDTMSDLDKENFGPLLHVIRYDADNLDAVIDKEINAVGYGLTLGIHSRIETRIDHIVARARVGNIYVNRGMTGAVVGVQPFGGMGLSGTGPKAGGPHYLYRFVTEKTVSVNTTASGGNTTLATMDGSL